MTALLRLKDPLLTTARFILKVMIWGAPIIQGAALAIAAVAYWNADKITYALAHGSHAIVVDGQPITVTHVSPDFVPAMVLLLIASTAIMAVVWVFLRLLKAIVDTVAAGDPFVPDNADRLRKMGWLMLSIQLLGAPIVAWLEWRMRADLGQIGSNFNIDGSGLLMVLTLFILARVFHHGAALRQDLEGTV